MSSTKCSKSRTQPITAPDVLGRSQNWVQKVSSIRMSNIRVGQHLTNLLGDKETTQQKHTSKDTFCPSFCKLLKLKHGRASLVFLGGESGVRIWLMALMTTHSQSEYSTDLLYDSSSSSDGDVASCVDLCFSQDDSPSPPPSSSNDDNGAASGDRITVYLLFALNRSSSTSIAGTGTVSEHLVRSLVVSGIYSSPSLPLQVAEGGQCYQGQGAASSIFCTKLFLLVTQTSTGAVHILSRLMHSNRLLRKVGEVPNSLNSSSSTKEPVVLAASTRWIAIQSKSISYSVRG
jgi:hypothetical protein